METCRFVLPLSAGDSGTPRLASPPGTDAASAQPAPPSMNAMAGHEPLRPKLLPVGAWIELARTSHYDALELRLHLGLSAEQFDGLGDTPFGRPAQDWLDFIRVYEAAVLAQGGCSQPEVGLSQWVRDGPGFWIWTDDCVDFAGPRVGQAIRIQRRAHGGSGRGSWPVLVLPGRGIAECCWPCGIGHPPNRPDAAECPLADGCQLAGHCLWHWICAGVACAREAIAGMALADRPLHKALEARWPQADRQHVA